MIHVRLRVLLLLAVHLPLLSAGPSRTEERSSLSSGDKAKSVSCGKDCKDRKRKRSTLVSKCDLYYFAPTATAPTEDDLFAFWNNSKAEQLDAYRKIASFLRANSREDEPLFFPAHIPLVETRNGRDVLVLKDIYVRAQGTCGFPEENDYYYTDWSANRKGRLQREIEMLEDYVQRMPRSHWGYRVPKADEDDVCLDDTGLVVKEFPGIRTCFSMWIFDDRDPKPKHFAGRQIYNRINQTQRADISKIGFDPWDGNSRGGPIGTKWFSLPALFLKEMCHVTSESLENRCTYWTTDHFYVSLCCCYTNRTECAYRNYTFPSQKKSNDTKIRACATGDYYLMKDFGGNHEPKNASESSVKEFVQERTSSELCKMTYTWNPRDETPREDVLRVGLGAEKRAAVMEEMRDCASNREEACCQRTTTLCPLDLDSNTDKIVAECFCSDGDLCNKEHSYLDKDRVKMYKEARPCETHTLYEHFIERVYAKPKPHSAAPDRYMCPVFYDFAHPGRENSFLQLLESNNLNFLDPPDAKVIRDGGCRLVDVEITEGGNCPEKFFGEHDESFDRVRLILLCSIEGNPLGEKRASYPDAELKKTIEANLTAAKAEFPTCKNGSWSLGFESVSELVVNSTKLKRWLFDNVTDGTNDDITTTLCYVEVSFVYQQQYNFTFGAVPIENASLLESCAESEFDSKCVRRNSAADHERQHFVCCCPRHWNQAQNMCRERQLEQLTSLLNESVIAETSQKIMGKLKEDPLTKCIELEKTDSMGQARTHINRPCARNDGCYTSVNARDIPTSSQPKEYAGCVSEYAPHVKKRDDSKSDEAEARFYRICRFPRNQGQCFAVLGTEDSALPDDVKGPQMVCCCGGRLGSAQKCDMSHHFGKTIGDFN